jgi:hypothetical protein
MSVVLELTRQNPAARLGGGPANKPPAKDFDLSGDQAPAELLPPSPVSPSETEADPAGVFLSTCRGLKKTSRRPIPRREIRTPGREMAVERAEIIVGGDVFRCGGELISFFSGQPSSPNP